MERFMISVVNVLGYGCYNTLGDKLSTKSTYTAWADFSQLEPRHLVVSSNKLT